MRAWLTLKLNATTRISVSSRTANAAHNQSVEPLVCAMTAVLGLVWIESRMAWRKVIVVVVKGVQRTPQGTDTVELGDLVSS